MKMLFLGISVRSTFEYLQFCLISGTRRRDLEDEGSAGSPRSSPSPLTNNQQVDKDTQFFLLTLELTRLSFHKYDQIYNTLSFQKDCNGDLWSFLKKEGGSGEDEGCKSEEEEEEEQKLRARLAHLPFPGNLSCHTLLAKIINPPSPGLLPASLPNPHLPPSLSPSHFSLLAAQLAWAAQQVGIANG